MEKMKTVDLARVLDGCRKGQRALKALEDQLESARTRYQELSNQAKGTPGPAQQTLSREIKAFEAENLSSLEDQRLALRAKLLDEVHGVLDDLRAEKGYAWILDSQVVIFCPSTSDITDEVIAHLDESYSADDNP